MKALNGRPIEVEFDYNSDGSAYFGAGWYLDGDGEELTSEELAELDEAYPEELEEAEFERQLERAEAMWEGDR